MKLNIKDGIINNEKSLYSFQDGRVVFYTTTKRLDKKPHPVYSYPQRFYQEHESIKK